MSIATATWTCVWVSTPTITFRASGWNVPDQEAFYTPGTRGYTDYPFLDRRGR